MHDTPPYQEAAGLAIHVAMPLAGVAESPSGAQGLDIPGVDLASNQARYAHAGVGVVVGAMEDRERIDATKGQRIACLVGLKGGPRFMAQVTGANTLIR